MEFVYLFTFGNEWEDSIIILSKEEAIKQSIDYPKKRVEIFSKINTNRYVPTYNYYQNGILIQNT